MRCGQSLLCYHLMLVPDSLDYFPHTATLQLDRRDIEALFEERNKFRLCRGALSFSDSRERQTLRISWLSLFLFFLWSKHWQQNQRSYSCSYLWLMMSQSAHSLSCTRCTRISWLINIKAIIFQTGSQIFSCPYIKFFLIQSNILNPI